MKELKKSLIFSYSGLLFTDLLACYDNYKFFSLNIQVVSIFVEILGAIFHLMRCSFQI